VRIGAIVAITVAALGLSACALVAGLGELEGNVTVKDGGAAADVEVETEDAGGGRDDASSTPDTSTSDSGGDASTNPCGDKPGPVPVRIESTAGAFCIDSTEVTNSQYAVFVAAKNNDTSGQPTRCTWNNSYVPSQNWPVTADKNEFPVAYVDWCDAYAYCLWAGKRLCGKIGGGSTPKNDRDEAEVSQWMNGCSGGGKTAFPYGASYSSAKCNTDRNQIAAVKANPECVGGYPGIFDMSGNVEEWEDQCDVITGASPVNDPCTNRGAGSYDGNSAGTYACGTTFQYVRGSRAKDIGFRCCSP
jgi:sulfatase modifying factor 1